MKDCLAKESGKTSSGVQPPFIDIVTSLADSVTHERSSSMVIMDERGNKKWEEEKSVSSSIQVAQLFYFCVLLAI